ncbi:hypothetical protein SLEP1_g28036 [Rubroshorea leprosula]|uniref:Alcohol dehydrogenase-like N-terminal domain-containing protein n=1 Tax=Rubroshorea leprosula TaxID=152421 RepID=A0AAV5JSB7_9ROSI|nr:hypothetical protein SLEP1_g28036 [Rubroshorea leprosula]
MFIYAPAFLRLLHCPLRQVWGVHFFCFYWLKPRRDLSSTVAGIEAVGEVIAVGPGVTDPKIGDLVGYVFEPIGSYAEEQILPADRVVPVPTSIDPIIAASIMMKGMTAQYLVRRLFKVDLVDTLMYQQPLP